jgi:argininosuccinate lyase
MSKLWGGRFKKETDELVEKFTKSIDFDYKLAICDVLGSMAHVSILERAGYLEPNEAKKLHEGLNTIYQSIENNQFQPDLTCEDIHTNIQNLLEKEVGDLVLKLHTARSRNDQVVFATKLYIKFEIFKIQQEITALTEAIKTLANSNKDIIIPGFTHLQHAQPVYLKDYLIAYAEMLSRDKNRLQYISNNIKISLGSGALAGTPLEWKYNEAATKFLEAGGKLAAKFQFKPIEAVSNSLDSVSDRDFIIETISALSILAMHLSRLSEDFILWSTKEFDFIELDEAYCTGSSLMPQKKNADVLELIRGNTGKLYGNLMNVLTMMKGLPLTYNRDMQLDKEPLFNSFETISIELKVLKGLIETLKFNKDKIAIQLDDESLYATDLVYYLVKKDVPFKQAHTIIGELVTYSIDHKIKIKDMLQDMLNQFSDKLLKDEIVKLFNPKISVESKKSIKRDEQ